MHWLLLVTFAYSTLALDLAAAKAEPNLERRSERALENANTALDTARTAYDAGDLPKTDAALNEVQESVELCYQSLSDTGKDPRNNRFFKKAEMATNQLLRRLETLRQSMSVLDRAGVDAVREHVSQVHDDLLNGIMRKKKK